jgi:ABC-2 type transport system ATP-binding protein
VDPAPVRVQGLRKELGARTALAGVDLEVHPRELVALVGPNGSGKTTLLRVLAGLLRPSAGTVRVFGLDPARERAAVMRRARFAFAPPALFAGLTAREHVAYLGGLGAPRPARSEVERALDLVGLAERADERAEVLSFGMRQRLAVAVALVPQPALLVLDEPTDGLDPRAVLSLRALLVRLRAEGIAVLCSSHLMFEVEKLADRLLVLSEGRVLVEGTPAELLGGTARLVLRVDEPARARAALLARGLRAEGEGEELSLDAGALDLEDARTLLGAAGVRLQGFHARPATLEEVVLARLAAEVRA